MGRLTNKNILITGGNSGIGLAAAQEFAERVRVSPYAASFALSSRLHQLPMVHSFHYSV